MSPLQRRFAHRVMNVPRHVAFSGSCLLSVIGNSKKAPWDIVWVQSANRSPALSFGQAKLMPAPS
jgi:hypothetical protein